MPNTPKQSDSTSAMEGLDPADPHPAEEGDPYNAHGPGAAAAKPAPQDIGPNPATHDGTAPPRPDNASTTAKP